LSFGTRDFSMKDKDRKGFVRHPYDAGEWSKILAPYHYDSEKAKAFEDALSSLCIGAGVKDVMLVVTDLDLPIAYGWASRTSPWEAVGSILYKGGLSEHAVAITKRFLAVDVTAYEIEAIVADVLARLYFRPEEISIHDRWRFVNAARLAEDGELDPDLIKTVLEEFPYNLIATMMLAQDTWAARLTKNPKALKEAVEKWFAILEEDPVESHHSCPLVFVDPPFVYDRQRYPTPPGQGNTPGDQRHVIAAKRTRFKELRCMNLELMKKGVGHPDGNLDSDHHLTNTDGEE